jgi:hypothetical protein
MKTYYHADSSKEIERILANGFTDEALQMRRGVYIANNPGPPDPAFPDDLLLEISLPEVIDLSSWELPESGAERREWIVPSVVLNQHAKLRRRARQEWAQLWATLRDKQTADVVQKLVAQGMLETATDSQGRLLYRITPKGVCFWRVFHRSISPRRRRTPALQLLYQPQSQAMNYFFYLRRREATDKLDAQFGIAAA